MDMEQVQRNDIDSLTVNTLSKEIEDKTLNNPYSLALIDEDYTCNNWIVSDTSFTKNVLPNSDALIFNVAEEKFLNKSITDLRLEFTCTISNGSPLLSDIGVDGSFAYANTVLRSSNSINLLALFPNTDFVDLLVNGFELVLKFDGNDSSASIVLTGLVLKITYASGLSNETTVLNNRGIDYSSLVNKPKVNGVELSGNKTSSDLGLTTWTNVSSQLGALDPSTLTHYLYVNDSIRIANYIYIGHHNSQTAGTDYERGNSVIPSSYRPLTVVGGQSNLNHGTVTVTSATSTYAGTVWYTANRTETESFYVYVNMYWRY